MRPWSAPCSPGTSSGSSSPAQVVEGLVWYQVETVVLQAGGSPIRGYMAAGSDGQVVPRAHDRPAAADTHAIGFALAVGHALTDNGR